MVFLKYVQSWTLHWVCFCTGVGVFKRKGSIATTSKGAWVVIILIVASILLLTGVEWSLAGDENRKSLIQITMLSLLMVVLILSLIGLKERRETANLFMTSFRVNPGLCAITVLETGEHLDVNQTWLDVLGYERHEVLGKTSDELKVWAGGAKKRAAMLRLLEDRDRIAGYEIQIRAKDGSLRDIILGVEKIEVGGQNRLFIAGQDITDKKRDEEIQQAQQAQLEALSEAPFDAIFFSEDGVCIGQNLAAEELFGYTQEEAVGELAHRWIADESRPLVNANMIAGHEQPYEAVGQRKDGSTFAVELHGKMTPYDGRLVQVTAIRDITERKRAHAQLRLLSAVVEQSPVAVMITDTEGVIEYVNPGFECSSGYCSAEVVGKSSSILNSGLGSDEVYGQLWTTITAGDPWSGEIQNRKKDGTTYWEQVNISPVAEPNGEVKHYLAVKEEITQRKEQEKQILFQAHYDGLTGLPNRFLALDRLSQVIKMALRENDKIAVLFIDLDDFKKVNDSFGHEVGDEALVESSRRLQKAVRAEDTVGRLGGDEFIIILAGIQSVQDVEPVVESVLEAFQTPFVVAKREVVVTVSVGIALYPNDGDTARSILKNADTAMYHSKTMGRNTYHFFTDEMNEGVARRLEVETQLRGALGRDELFLNYQPVIDLHTRQIVGAEALVRWDNQQLGTVSPVEFVAIAERTGLIVDIGEFVLRRAAQEAAGWTKGSDFKLAVNISPRQFRDKQLISTVTAICSEFGLPLESLEFEITEGVLMCGESTATTVLNSLRKMGAGISMDDFGTGYSSLSYLRRYPFDTLKIDKSFVADINSDYEDRMLISATINMAKSLGLKVIAEGIENRDQLAFLVGEGCDLGQGYYFSRPVSAKRFESLLEESVNFSALPV